MTSFDSVRRHALPRLAGWLAAAALPTALPAALTGRFASHELPPPVLDQ